ncbi:unnamed protein product [Adineta ricciae]|uniref:Uncharacterized protein n=1 Tax=Adineta ricciae TaxID=249248 RepID=A0A814V7T9_ADIRI|nr:unnamed protein product [Adineta ricciae]
MASIVFLFLIVSLLSLKDQTAASLSYSCAYRNTSVQFTLLTSAHSASNSASSCSLQQCNGTSADNQTCSLSPTPCFDYRTMNNISYCAPGVDCSVLQPCDNVTHSCASNDSVCIVNSCCSPSAVCLPVLTTEFCSRGKATTFRIESIDDRIIGYTIAALLCMLDTALILSQNDLGHNEERI